MAEITDPKQAGERLLQFAREGRLVQGTWHDEEDGREVACLLGAAAGIDEPDQCPASLMPGWLAHALPALVDGQSESHAIAFAIRWGEAMVRPEWTMIDWDAVRTQWLAFVMQQARAAASAYAYAAAKSDANADYDAAYAAAAAVDYAAACVVADAVDYVAAAADAADYAAAAAADARPSRDAQGDALMNAIEKAMEVARG